MHLYISGVWLGVILKIDTIRHMFTEIGLRTQKTAHFNNQRDWGGGRYLYMHIQ